MALPALGTHTPTDQMKPVPQLPGLGGTYWTATGLMELNSEQQASRQQAVRRPRDLHLQLQPGSPNWESSQLRAPEPSAPGATQPQQTYPLRSEAALLGGLSPYDCWRQQGSNSQFTCCILPMDTLAAIDINSRVILVFISSTFRDFTNEPDMLVEQVFASLLSKAQEWSLIRW